MILTLLLVSDILLKSEFVPTFYNVKGKENEADAKLIKDISEKIAQ